MKAKVWKTLSKLKNFTAIQILREINFGEFRVSKPAILRVLKMKNGRISPKLNNQIL